MVGIVLKRKMKFAILSTHKNAKCYQNYEKKHRRAKGTTGRDLDLGRSSCGPGSASTLLALAWLGVSFRADRFGVLGIRD